MTVGATIKALRTRTYLNQKDLAKATGITQATISRIEKDKIKAVSADTLSRVAKALNVSTDHLLGKSEKLKWDEITLDSKEVRDLVTAYQKLPPFMRQWVFELVRDIKIPPKAAENLSLSKRGSK